MPGFDIFKQITDQADSWKVITPLLAVVVSFIGGGGLVGIVTLWWNHRQKRLKQARYRKIPSGDFPFEVIPPNTKTVLKQLMPGSNDDDPLADANIPYLQRRLDRNVRQDLERAFEAKPWVLILGRTGLGKTREAAQLAQLLNDEGWTILNLADKPGAWLDEPRQFPSEISPNAKLLFFLDDLNRWLYQGNPREIPKDADDPAQPLRVSVQKRLLKTLEFFERECRNQVRVIATARNERNRHSDRPHEPSEFEKLQFEKYSEFWNRFYLYELVEPSDAAIVALLSDRVEAAHLRAKTEEFPQIARRNDRTFRNIVENLRTAANRELVVSVNELSESLDRTWRVRYNAAVKRYPEAKYIYDAVEVLRSLNLSLHPAMVEVTARLFVQQRGVKRLWILWKLQQALRFLMESEEILKPRDGQIEAKLYQVGVGRYASLVLRKLSDIGRKHYSQSFLASEFLSCGKTLYDLEHYSEAIATFDKAIKLKPDNQYLWNLRGDALRKLKRYDEAIASFDEAIKLKPDDQYVHYIWFGRGIVLMRIEHYKDAIASFDEAIKLKPDDQYVQYVWFACGIALEKLNRYEEAIAIYNQALEQRPDNHEAWYYKACCYALQGDAELAIKNLKTSIDLGSESRGWAKTDSAFDSICNDDRFQALINEHQNE